MPANAPSPELIAALASSTPPVPADRMQVLRATVRRAREIEAEIADIGEREAEKKQELGRLLREELPDLFGEMSIREITVEAEGNRPEVRARAKAFYQANIAADWEEPRRERAFQWLEDNGDGDIIKREFTILLGREEDERSRELAKLLREAGFVYTVKKSVPWNTLTAWLREMVEKREVTPPLETFGATVGRVVELKDMKD
jgi:hypothetical protein